jgi:hypothetical protein
MVTNQQWNKDVVPALAITLGVQSKDEMLEIAEFIGLPAEDLDVMQAPTSFGVWAKPEADSGPARPHAPGLLPAFEPSPRAEVDQKPEQMAEPASEDGKAVSEASSKPRRRPRSTSSSRSPSPAPKRHKAKSKLVEELEKELALLKAKEADAKKESRSSKEAHDSKKTKHTDLENKKDNKAKVPKHKDSKVKDVEKDKDQHRKKDGKDKDTAKGSEVVA